VKRIYNVEPHPAASRPQGEANAQPSAGAEIDGLWEREGWTHAGGL